MKVCNLINHLLALDEKDTEIVIRDVNGCDWELEEVLVFAEKDRVVINSEGINKVDHEVDFQYHRIGRD